MEKMEYFKNYSKTEIKYILKKVAQKIEQREEKVVDIKTDEKLCNLKKYQNYLFDKLREMEQKECENASFNF